jgi:surface-anchored protein
MPVPPPSTITNRLRGKVRTMTFLLSYFALAAIALPLSSRLHADPWIDRTVLTNQHVDLRVLPPASTGEAPTLVVVNSDTGTVHLPDDALLVVPESARLEIPPGLDALGPAGSSLWILPQGQNPKLLYLGFSVSSQLAESFQSPIAIRLKTITGPGAFIGWQSASFGDLNIHFDSRDGFDNEDVFTALISGHDHMNWGFTAPGWYGIVLQIEAVSTFTGELIASPDFTLLFAVEPLPQAPPDPVQLSIRLTDQADIAELTLEDTREGFEYQVWHSPHLDSWELLDTWTATGPILTVLVPASQSARFYQVRRPIAARHHTSVPSVAP